MRKQYTQHAAQKRMSGGKKALLTVLIIVLSVILFKASFWISSMVLKANQQPNLPDVPGASPTPKPTYEQLEKMVIEKDEEIKKLQEELELYKKNGGSTSGSSTGSSKSSTTSSSRATKAPSATKKATAQPTKAPTPAPTQAPTKAPEPEVTQAPAEETQGTEAGGGAEAE